MNFSARGIASEDQELIQLVSSEGPWTFAYTDGPGDEPQVVEDARRRSIEDQLRDAGAPSEDVEAVTSTLATATGLSSPSTRYILARNGRVELDESFSESRLGPEAFGHATTPAIVPLLRHRAGAARYLVVETGREGATVRLESARNNTADRTVDIDGRDDSLLKVRAGGLSHARYHRHSEEIWKHNQSEIAEVVDRLVREEQPAFLVVAGDLRARQLLRESLAPLSQDLVVEVDAHTRASGSDSDALDEAIQSSLDSLQDGRVAAAHDEASAGDGDRQARGLRAVVEALQQARVDTLILDARLLEGGEPIHVLDAPPWVSREDDIPGDARVLGLRPVAEALARAAVLTRARLYIEDEEADAPRTDREPPEPIALLRWPDSDASDE